MEPLEILHRRLETTEQLRDVVKTMKALAAVNLRRCEKAVASLGQYNRTIQLGLQVALRGRPEHPPAARLAPRQRLAAVIIGSDQGMCGQLNDQLAAYALSVLADGPGKTEDRVVLAVGGRVAARLEDGGVRLEKVLATPGAVSRIGMTAREILLQIEAWRATSGVDVVWVLFIRPVSGTVRKPERLRLLPLDRAWLERLKGFRWPTRLLPMFTLPWDVLVSALTRQYLIASLHGALAESQAAENASRLESMQNAERNIDERIGELTALCNRERQAKVTEELLDIVSGFECLHDAAGDRQGAGLRRSNKPRTAGA